MHPVSKPCLLQPGHELPPAEPVLPAAPARLSGSPAGILSATSAASTLLPATAAAGHHRGRARKEKGRRLLEELLPVHTMHGSVLLVLQ